MVAVDDVSFEVGAGEIVGLLGPNGAGKTTTIKCICTLVLPTSGQIEVQGADAIASPRAAVRNIAAVLEGNRNIYWNFTVKENLEFFAALHGIHPKSVASEMDELIQRFGLEDKTNTPGRMLSRGMQQKVAVACAFIKRTPLLLLDEPTLGLDIETSYDVRQTLKELSSQRTILLSSHDMDVVQDVCARVIIINQGRIVVDDRVSSLLSLFSARAFEFELTGVLDQSVQSEIKRRFPLTEVEVDDDRSRLRVEMLDGVLIYELIDLIRSSDVLIESMGRKDPDLEEIFLKIVREGRA